jgi:arylformamidase
LFIHGGYWRGSDKSEYSFIGKAWQDAGITAVLLNYALMPKVSLSTIIEQITNAIIWVYQHIEEYSGNKKSLFLSGHSAGGYLATKMMMTPWQELLELNDQNLLQACFTMSGLYDLEPLTRASFIAADLGLTSSQAQSLSVINPSNPKNTLSKNATVYAAIGNDEGQGFHDQQNLLKRYWPDALVRSFILQNCNHFTIMDQLGDKDSLLFQAVLQMIDSQLKNQIKNRTGSLDSC